MARAGQREMKYVLILTCSCNEVREIILPSQMAPKSSWEREMPFLEKYFKDDLRVKKRVTEDLTVHGCSGAPRGN